VDTLTIFFIGIGLAMDCFAVSFTGGLCLRCIQFKDSLKVSFSFGLFQAIMPIIGWLLGTTFKNYIADFDHWIAFGLLGLIGLKMIVDTIRHKPENQRFLITRWKVLLSMSFATSIDAMIIGIGFSFMAVNILKAIIMIGVITVLISFLGLYLGKKSSKFTGSKAEIIGGLVLILMGTKILFEHLGIINW